MGREAQGVTDMMYMTDRKKYLVGIDIGTTSLKTAIFDTDGNMVSSSTMIILSIQREALSNLMLLNIFQL